MFKLGTRSKANLVGVNSDLVDIVERAIQITPVDFVVIEGLRSLARQKELVANGKSQTMKSRHLTGHAVDVAAIGPDGKVSWDMKLYRQIASAFVSASLQLGRSVEWGGNWKTFQDGPHFQLPKKDYPDV